MPVSKSAPRTFCDSCKTEFGSFDSKTGIWSFRGVDPQAYVTVVSETARAKGAVRSYCRYHLQENSRWTNKGEVSIWPISEQMAYAKQLEMAAANV